MYSVTFIRLIENEYLDLLRECSSLKKEKGFELFDKPLYICERVQKFRNWMIMAIRSSEVTRDGEPLRPEDVIVEAAITKTSSTPSEPVHPNLISALTLFEKTDLDGIIGEKRRLMLEQAMGQKIDKCKFEICFSHCEFVRKEIMPVRKEQSYDGDASPTY